VRGGVRVAMLINGYPPRLGGAEQQVAAMSAWLHRQGVQVTVVTRRMPGVARFEVVDGVPVHRLPVPGPKPVASLSYTLAAMRLLRRLRPDILHAHELFSTATSALAAKPLVRAPVVATAHRSGADGDVQRLRRKLFGRTRIAALRRQVDAFVCISREIEAELAGIGIAPARCHHIPNAVDTEHFKPVPDGGKPELRARLGLPDQLTAIFTGRLAPEKRVEQLLAIWPAVRAKCPEARLLILGSGPQQPALERMAGAGVSFLGRIADVAPYLRAADVFILPSAAEGLSVALLEAMASGLAVLVTDVGGGRDVVRPADNGWLVPPEDPPALQAAVLRLLGDAALRASLGSRARQDMERAHALPVIGGQLVALYDRLLNGG